MSRIKTFKTVDQTHLSHPQLKHHHYECQRHRLPNRHHIADSVYKVQKQHLSSRILWTKKKHIPRSRQ